MLEKLKKQVCMANQAIVSRGLVIETFGNVSGVDRRSGHVIIKPSGVSYDKLAPELMVVVDLETGKVDDGDLRPSRDTETHLQLYRTFKDIGGIAHTRSMYATAWAQARREITALGTTHADFFRGYIPCTRLLDSEEIANDYEKAMGQAIIERFAKINPMEVPAALVADHGPFAWGATVEDAVHNAGLVEYLAHLAFITVSIDQSPLPISRDLLDRHYIRNHEKEGDSSVTPAKGKK